MKKALLKVFMGGFLFLGGCIIFSLCMVVAELEGFVPSDIAWERFLSCVFMIAGIVFMVLGTLAEKSKEIPSIKNDAAQK